MANQTVEVLVEGGKATAAPPLGPALGPLGLNIGLVVSEINKKTAGFKGMQVPVKVVVNESKEFTITVGTPPASQLILKEAGIQKGSSNPLLEKVADLKIEQIIKIAKMKDDSLLGKTLKEKIKEVVGSCQSIGVMVEGVDARTALKQIEEGKYDAEIKAEKTELSAEELKQLEEERKKLQEDVTKKHAQEEAKATSIIKEMEGKERSLIKAKLKEAGISEALIAKLLPAESKGDEKKGGATPGKK
ncbi:MAG: 50S ribosomal protein L11 [Candidatus Woesearchaeota archaeon]